jgi:hypothetical protein
MRRQNLGRKLALVLLLPSALLAQPRVDWFTVGGGGTSSGGRYSVSGTVGQPEAGATSTNGQFSVTGGFWPLPIAIRPPGSPTLSIIAAAHGYAQISWTPHSVAYVLQESLSLTPTNWVNAPSGTTNPVTVPLASPLKFYRLFGP